MSDNIDLDAMERRAQAAAAQTHVDPMGHCIYCGISPYELNELGQPIALNCCETQVQAVEKYGLAADNAALIAEVRQARELLLSAYYQLDPIYLADGVTLHPGCVSTLHELYAYLWPEGRKAGE